MSLFDPPITSVRKAGIIVYMLQLKQGDLGKKNNLLMIIQANERGGERGREDINLLLYSQKIVS